MYVLYGLNNLENNQVTSSYHLIISLSIYIYIYIYNRSVCVCASSILRAPGFRRVPEGMAFVAMYCRAFSPDFTMQWKQRTPGTPGGTVKGQSRSDSLLLSPYHWAKLLRGVVAIVAVPMRFAVICWIVLEAFVGQIHVFPLGSWIWLRKTRGLHILISC